MSGCNGNCVQGRICDCDDALPGDGQNLRLGLAIGLVLAALMVAVVAGLVQVLA